MLWSFVRIQSKSAYCLLFADPIYSNLLPLTSLPIPFPSRSPITTSPSPISLPRHELSSQSLPRYAHLSPSPSLTNLSRSSRSISADPANVLGSRGNGANSSTGEDGGGVIHPGTPKKVARRRVLLRKYMILSFGN